MIYRQSGSTITTNIIRILRKEEMELFAEVSDTQMQSASDGVSEG